MNNQECRYCLYAVDGACRLENNLGIKKPECPYKEELYAAVSVL